MSIVPPTGIVRKFYEEAVANEIEYTSSAFWQIWLQRAFHELDTYAVVCEYSPDGSRGRCDILVRRYDIDNHNIISLIWHEAKRPSGNSRAAETQAKDRAERCIQTENLLHVYAITTVGLSFRLWKFQKKRPGLMPFEFDNMVVDRYIPAESADAWIMNEFIRIVKIDYPVREAPVVPSQAHLLFAAPFGELGESSMQGQSDASVPSEFEFAAAPMEEEEYDDAEVAAAVTDIPGPMEEGSESMAEGSARMEEVAEPRWERTHVRRTSHLTRRDEFVFVTTKGHSRSTDRDDWIEVLVKGKRAWSYLHKGTYYYTREKPGG